MRLKIIVLSLLAAVTLTVTLFLGNRLVPPAVAQVPHLNPASSKSVAYAIQHLPQMTTNNPTLPTTDLMAWLAEGKVGRIGVAARLIEGGLPIALNGNETFPMASTVKVPIAMALMHLVDEGELQLDTLVELNDDEWVISDVIASNFIHPGVALSVANLIEVMITHSDNTATDVCLRLVGGPAAVDTYVASRGIEKMNVSRYMRDLLSDFYGLPSGRENLQEVLAFQAGNPEQAAAPSSKFEADPRDQVQPHAMLDLLLQLVNGEALSSESTEFLLGVMGRKKPGLND